MTRWIALWALFALLAAPAAAQQPLSLQAAVEEALGQNPALRAVRAQADQMAARVAEARAVRLPHITFAEAWQTSTQPVFGFSALLAARRFTQADFAVDRLNSPGRVSAFVGRITADQVLFDGGRMRAASQAAESSGDIAQAELDAAAAALTVNVTRLYGRVVAADAAVRATAAAVEAAREDAARAERRRAAGTVTDADALAIAVHLAEMQRLAIDAGGEAAIARAELNRATGSAIDRPFDVVAPPAPAPAPRDLQALLAEAERARPEMRRAAAARAAAAAGVRAARATWMPQVTARAGYELNGLTFGDRAGAWLAGGELSWRLSVGGTERARTRAAAAALAAADAARDEARAAIHLDVVAALRRLESAQARAGVGRQSLEQAQEAHRILRNRYEAGMAGLTELLRAVAASLDAERHHVAAGVDLLVATAELDRALGRYPIASPR